MPTESDIRAELKRKLDPKKLNDIETDAKSYGKMASESRREFILSLWYLQFTNRFRENPVYKNETFGRYIFDLFNLRIHTYNQERMAFIAAGDAAEKYGPGFITKIAATAGQHNVHVVLNEIESAKKHTAAEYDRIIQKHAKPAKPVPVKRKNAAPKEQLSPAEYVRREVILEKRNAELEKLLVEKDEQITKLVSALSKYKEAEKSDKDEIKKLKGLLAQFHEMTARINKTASLYNGLTGMKG